MRGVFTCGVTCEVGWFFALAFAFLVFIVLYIYAFEWGSMGSLIGVSGFTVWQGIIFFLRYQAQLSNGYAIALFMVLLAFNLITWIAHHKNLYRLKDRERLNPDKPCIIDIKRKTYGFLIVIMLILLMSSFKPLWFLEM